MSDEISLARGWTLEAYVAHNEAIRVKDAEVWTEHERFLAERDRRYTEVKQAEEKALAIKEKADEKALGLQAQNQAYRDEKGNELREQIERERGTYVQRTEFKPVSEYVLGQQGGPRALTTGGILAAVAAIGVAGTLWYSSHRPAASTPSPTVVCTATYHPAPCP